MNKRYVVGLGEALWDVLPDGKKLGGAPANFAYHAGQFGLDTIAVSALGEDKLAEETIKALEEHGLTYLMPRVPYPTGTVQVTLSGDGIPSYEIRENVAWDNIPYTPEMTDIAKHCRAVCFGSLAQRNVTSWATIRQFLDDTPKDCLKIFDINLRQQFFTKNVIEESLKRCNVLKINDEEVVTFSHLFGYEGLDMRETCQKTADAGTYLWHQRLVCLHAKHYVLPGHAESGGCRHSRRWRLVHGLVLRSHPERQEHRGSSQDCREGLCLRLHPERRYADVFERTDSVSKVNS